MTEQEIRQKIHDEIMSIDLSEAKEISPDYFMAALRMRTVCAIIAEKGLPNA